jgi:predicted nucleic acid-binding protein
LILADTSVWIDHLRQGDAQMAKLLLTGQIVMHPFVVGEIALGSLRNRRQRLKEMDALRVVTVARIDEVRQMIEIHPLYSKGIGLTDAHLIASCLLTSGTLLWTRDNGLRKVAVSLGVNADLP